AGTTDYTPAPTKSVTITVDRAGQAIVFDPAPPTRGTVGGTWTPAATGGGSGQPVTFAIDPAATTNNACTLNDQDVVSFVRAGTCVVTADQAGTTDYTPAPTQPVTITVDRAGQAIVFDPAPPTRGTVGGTWTPAATGGGSGQPVTFAIDPAATTNNACTLNDQDVVSFVRAGTCVVTADQAGTTDYTPAPTKSVTITVDRAGTWMDLTLSADQTAYGQPVTATARTSAAGAVRFLLDGTQLGAPVPTSGGETTSPPITDPATGRPLTPGTYTLTATLEPTSPELAGSAASATLRVTRAETTTTLTLDGQDLTVLVGPAGSPDPGVGRPSGEVTVTVGDTEVGTATLDQGVATIPVDEFPGGLPDGAVVTATYAGDTNYTGSTATISRTNPTLTATLTGTKGNRGWYVGPVTITFTCTPDTAPLTGPCPGPVVLRRNGADQTRTRTITATDGGTTTLTVAGIDIDRTKPRVKIRRTATRGVRCTATDPVSGLTPRGCTLKRTRTPRAVVYTATATDQAGNTRTVRLKVRR
ncbi:Ig-like domain repeat protein, partial [Nocardioides hungaricus]